MINNFNNEKTANISTGDKIAIAVNVGLFTYFTKNMIKNSIKYGVTRVSVSASGSGQLISSTLSTVANQAGTVLASSPTIANMATGVAAISSTIAATGTTIASSQVVAGLATAAATASNAAAATSSAIASSQIATGLVTVATAVSNAAAVTSSAIASSQTAALATAAAAATAPAVIVGTVTAVTVIGCYKFGSASYESYQAKRQEFLLNEIAQLNKDIEKIRKEIKGLIPKRPELSNEILKLDGLQAELKVVRANNFELNQRIQAIRDEINNINQQNLRANLSM